MIWIYLAFGSVALLLAVFILFRLATGALFYGRPRPLMAPARRVPDCSVPSDPATLTALDASTTGGVYRAPNVVVPAGTTITLTSTLIVVADLSLQVDGTITVSPNPVPANRPVDIILVCLAGDVVVSGTVGVPFAGTVQAPAGVSSNVAANYASASGGVGEHAGYIKIVSPQGSIDITGRISAVGGGSGGSPTATGVAGRWNLFGGTAGAAGGQGGAGGDVKLCAFEAIHVGPQGVVFAGMGGSGGIAKANAVNASPAYAEGGPSNNAGDVWIDGLAQGATTQVFNEGTVQGGSVQFGNLAQANGGNALRAGDKGGNACARGGRGRSRRDRSL